MSNQIVISSGAKVRSLEGVLTGTAGVVNALAINVPNGIPQLDGSGKILVSQLPNSVMEYKGTWNAATNTPTLVNGTGNQGDVYLCNVAGTTDFGAGPITFAVGDQAIYSGTIWQKAGGSTGTVTSVAVTETGDALTITGSPITTSGTINIGFAGISGQYINGAGGLTTFPSLTGYVPYTGATQDVDLDTFKLNAQSLHAKGTGGLGHLGLKHQSASATASANDASLFADSLGDLSWLNGNLYLSKFITSGNSAARSYTFPNASGTVALTTDLGSYLPLTGGTLTGALYGTSAEFSGSLLVNGDANFIGRLGAKFGIIIEKGNTPATLSLLDVYISASGGPTNSLKIQNTNYLSTLNFPQSNQTFTFPAATGTIALTSDISYPVTNVFGRTGAVVATSGDYTTTQVTEGTNLYFTDTRARAALSFVAGSGAYNSTTGVITIPTDNNQIGNSAGYITSSALSAYLPLAGGTLSGALNGTSAVFSSTVQASAYRLTGMTAGAGALYWASDRVTLANYNAGGVVRIEANGGTTISIFGGATYNNDFVGTGRFTGELTGTSATFSSSVTTNGNIIYINGAQPETRYTENDVGALPLGLWRTVLGGDAFYVQKNTAVAGDFSTTINCLQFTSTGVALFSNNVGIGTTVINEKLDVEGNMVLRNSGTYSTSLTRDIIYRSSTSSFGIQPIANIQFATVGNAESEMRFSTRNGAADYATRMTISKSGNVGIGLSAPKTILQINAGSGAYPTLGTNVTNSFFVGRNDGLIGMYLGYAADGNGWIQQMRNDSASSANLILQPSGGDVLIGTTSSPSTYGKVTIRGTNAGLTIQDAATNVYRAIYSQSGNLYFYNGSNEGYLNTAGAWVNASDISIKKDVKDLEYGLKEVLNLKPKSYKMINNDLAQIGFIAQEVEQILPELVDESNKGMKGLSYGQMTAVLVKAIQEQQAQIEELKAKIK
jgi:hypothetical protein